MAQNEIRNENEGTRLNKDFEKDLEQQAGTGRSYDYGVTGSNEEGSGNGSKGTVRQNENDGSSTPNRSNSNSDHENASANRGGTTDMGSEILTGPGQTGRQTTSTTTKRNVTGSDYDGQVSE